MNPVRTILPVLVLSACVCPDLAVEEPDCEGDPAFEVDAVTYGPAAWDGLDIDVDGQVCGYERDSVLLEPYLIDPVGQDKKIYLELYPNASNALRLGFMDDLPAGSGYQEAPAASSMPPPSFPCDCRPRDQWRNRIRGGP